MTPRTIHVLHIEDDAIQQLCVAHHLAAMAEFHFGITCVASEDEAVEAFPRRRTDLVILDYQLSQGNGLSCLRKLRQRDATVPIVAVSGVATPEIAGELLHAGADEYLHKHTLDSDVLARSVRHILARTEALRHGAVAGDVNQRARIETLVRQVCETFRSSVRPEFFQQLDDLEAAAFQANLNAKDVQCMFSAACAELGSFHSADRTAYERRLRPVVLEILVRLFETPFDGKVG